jgi:hypothetical protein
MHGGNKMTGIAYKQENLLADLDLVPTCDLSLLAFARTRSELRIRAEKLQRFMVDRGLAEKHPVSKDRQENRVHFAQAMNNATNVLTDS